RYLSRRRVDSQLLPSSKDPMKAIRIFYWAVGWFCLLSAVMHAQVPQLINYQGRVAVGGVNFDGSGAFKFALVNPLGVLLWSNDGTSGVNTEPAAAVSVPVSKGLYSVLLGDTTLANMT